jgi:hypothetical protein
LISAKGIFSIEQELSVETVRLIADSCQHLKPLNLHSVAQIGDYLIHVIRKLKKRLITLVLDGTLTDAAYLYWCDEDKHET